MNNAEINTVTPVLWGMFGAFMAVVSFVWNPSESKLSNFFAWFLLALASSLCFSFTIVDIGKFDFFPVAQIVFPAIFAVTFVIRLLARGWGESFTL